MLNTLEWVSPLTSEEKSASNEASHCLNQPIPSQENQHETKGDKNKMIH